ncbi:Cyclin-U2-1 [Rhynchospora pubera]|uniref:Cyclin n=1 Tax=Rhynchospora pubera TaxID=906938 RepID=A0AAV8GAW1_9POAL|nr:Cyclin-U2-1 [Rhynchospora pubera]
MSPRTLRSDLYSFTSEEERTAPPLVISVLASLLERTISRNQRGIAGNGNSKNERIAAFERSSVLDMSIQSFLERVFRYAHAAPPVYVVAYVYMDRLCQFNQGLHIVSTNVHRLLITSIMVASKFVEDLNYCNSYFAKIGGLSTAELNSLEMNFLFLMGFRLNVSPSIFESYCSHLEREVSFGGGYQIERCLRNYMCGVEIASKERKRPESKNQFARVL